MTKPSSDLIGAANLAYIESLQAQFQADPAAVPDAWRAYFSEAAEGEGGSVGFGPSFAPRSLFNPSPGQDSTAANRPKWSGKPAPVVRDGDSERRLPLLYRLQLFSTLPEEALLLIANCTEAQQVKAGVTIFEAGSDGDALYIIETGKVEIIRGGDHVAF